MAEFLKALALTLPHEGGYVDDPDDNGKETYRGISRLNNPRWKGWEIVDKNKPLKTGAIIKDPVLDSLIAAIYKVDYWNKVWGDNMQKQDVANFLFDWYVNSGYHAVEAVQLILKLSIDGVMGAKTVKAINDYAYNDLVTKLIAARTKFVKNLVFRSPKNEKYLDGWMNRINSYAA